MDFWRIFQNPTFFGHVTSSRDANFGVLIGVIGLC